MKNEKDVAKLVAQAARLLDQADEIIGNLSTDQEWCEGDGAECIENVDNLHRSIEELGYFANAID